MASSFCLDLCAQIIGGKESVPHSKPFMAKIKGPKLCGGTLIKSNWVLTAAHCTITNNTEVILGIHSEKDTTKQVFNLNKQAKLNKNVAIVKLPRVYGDLKAGTQCLVAGWGVTQSGHKTPSDVLREVNVSVIARSTCNDQKHYNYQPLVTMNMVCAGDKRGAKDACFGDSGGPLMCKGEQRGIVSTGKGCGQTKYPGIYTLLTDKYSRWIKSVIQGSL
ncbi:hypothetical protein Chor_007960 [Crotalus horridus]